MVYNRFFFKVLIRIVVMLLMMLTIAYIFSRYDLWYTQCILVLVLISLVVELTIFVNRTNYDLARFVNSVIHEDFTINFTQTSRTQSFNTLHQSFNEFVGAFRELQTRNAAQFHFLKQLVDQIEFGIITFEENDDIHLINSQAQVLLELPAVTDWQKLNNPNTAFLEKLLNLPLTKNQLIETKIGEYTRSFSVSMMTVVIEKKRYKIASFQDIRSEIQSKEIEAWHKLIKILTHEIMNSVTPMVSLTETVQMILKNEDQSEKKLYQLDEENITDINEAIETIKGRSEGILKFIGNYRKLTKTPLPVLEETSVEHLIRGILLLMDEKLKDIKVELVLNDVDAKIKIDDSLISQVLINLVKNALESMRAVSHPCLEISAGIMDEYYYISICDNGPGIDSEQIEKIFVPFYTTKDDGSGVGLALSRQIMNLHGGYLDVDSMPNQRTVFSMMFPRNLYVG